MFIFLLIILIALYYILTCGRWALFKFIDPAYQRCYTQAELNRLLKAAGFKVVKDSKVRFGFIWELITVTAIANSNCFDAVNSSRSTFF